MTTFAAAKNRQNAVRVLEELERRGGLRPAEEAALDRFRAAAPADREEIGKTRATYLGAGQGATLGLADEIGLQDRAAVNAARDQHPDEFQTGKLAGGAATSVVPFGIGMSAARGLGLVGQAAVGAGIGSGMAAFQGFNEGEGGFGPRVRNAAQPGPLAIGAGTGAAAPVAGRAIGSLVGRAVTNPSAEVARAGMDKRAARLLTRSFNDDAAVLPDAQQVLRSLGDDGMIADLGRNTRLQASGLARLPGAAGQRVVTAMDARDAGAAGRINRTLDRATQAPEDQALSLATRKADRSLRFGPLYDAARGSAEPRNTAAIRAYIEQAEREAAPGASSLKRAGRDLKQSGLEGDETTAAALHNVRSRLSDQAEEARRAGRGNEALQLQNALRLIDEELDKVPGYAVARSGWAESKALDDAALEGRAVLQSGYRSDDFRQRWGSMSDPEREAFRSAARDAIEQKLGSAVSEDRAGINLLGPRKVREKLEIVFGRDAVEQIERRAIAERQFKLTRQKATAGSETAANQAAQRELAPWVDEQGNRVSPVQRLRGAVERPVNAVADALMRPNARTLESLADGLTAQGAERDKLIGALLAGASEQQRQQRISDTSRYVVEALLKGSGGGAAVAGVR